MTTATAQGRLRQIAILVSSVDAAAARQILLHLPTETAKQVRSLAARLGEIRPEEKRQILAEFQRSAVAPNRAPRPAAASNPTAGANHLELDRGGPPERLEAQASEGKSSRLADSVDAAFSDQAGTGKWDGPRSGEQPTGNQAAWTRLSTAALVKFVRDERPAVMAVVVSQLAPSVAVEVLRRLPIETSRDVLHRISHLQDIDPEAMTAIDEHLSQRLGEYEYQLDSQLENVRRIQALLTVAPEALRRQWSEGLDIPVEALGSPDTSSPMNSNDQDGQDLLYPTSEADILDLTDSGQAAGPRLDPKPNRASSEAEANRAPRSNSDQQDVPQSGDILPFVSSADARLNSFERSLIQLEFEQILHLPPQELATLLSASDSESVLLALAGASPGFMRRFYAMLNRSDAKALQRRLQNVGAVALRDIDEAQRQIVENAAHLSAQRTGFAKSAHAA